MKYNCACCNYKTLTEKPPGTYEICPVCFWEDDYEQYINENYEGGANSISLKNARQNFIKYKVSDIRYKGRVREPNDDEKY